MAVGRDREFAMSAWGPYVTLTSDFGGRDGYVAAMKGVVLSEAPSAIVVDAAHVVGREKACGGRQGRFGTFRNQRGAFPRTR